MKEKRRIDKYGYYEVSKDGGKTWSKTTMRPTKEEIRDYKDYNTGNTSAPTTKKGGVREKYYFDNMIPKEVTLPVGGTDFSKMFEKTSKPNNLEDMDVKDTELPSLTSLYPKKPVAERKYGAGLETILGAAQAGYGLQQLMKDKRPTDVIDPTFSRLTDEAVAASRYGYTPEQKAALKSDIVNARIAQQARINQLAGGSAGVGLSNVRAALNEELMNKYKLEAQDEQMRMQKAQVAAGLAGQRAGMSRQLFADKMNEFMQKQQAGAELLGAGIQNIIGAKRYQQEKLAQEQLNKMMGIN